MTLHYKLYGNTQASQKILFIMGMSTSHAAWEFQAKYFGLLPEYEVRGRHMCVCVCMHMCVCGAPYEARNTV